MASGTASLECAVVGIPQIVVYRVDPLTWAVGKRLGDLFPGDLAAQFERVRGETGIHHIYKFVWKPQAAAAASTTCTALALVQQMSVSAFTSAVVLT